MRFALALGTILMSSATFAAETKLVPLSDFAKPTEVRTIALSPDGKTLALISPKGDYGTVLAFIDTETMKATAGFSDNGERVPGDLQWANNDRVIISLVRKYGGFARPARTGELLGVNRDGKKLNMLFGSLGEMSTGTNLKTRALDRGTAAVADPLINDAKFALITINSFADDGSFTELQRMNEITGSHTRLVRAPIRDGAFLLDHEAMPRLAYGTNNDGALQVFRRNGEAWEIVSDEVKNGERMLPLSFARDNQTFYAFWGTQTGPEILVQVDLKTMKRTTVYAPEVASPVEVFKTADDKDIFAVLTQEGASKIHIVDEGAPEAKAWRAFSKSFPGSLVEPVDFSSDGETALFKVSASNNSGEYYLFNVKKNSAKFLFPADSWMDPERMAKTIPFELSARDGLALHGYLTLPNVSSQKGLPLVVMPHGGPHVVRDHDRYDEWAQVLASRGYAVLKVNFRGSIGYGAKFQIAGYREWGRKMQDDVTDATKWAIDAGYADANRIAIVGASYGGYSALMGGAREPELYRAIVSYVGVSDLELMYTRGDLEDSLYGQSYLKQVLSADKAELKARSPVNLAAEITAPVLIIHGGQDQRVPVVHGLRMRDALKDADKEVEYFEVQDEMHGFYKQVNKVQAYTRMLTFLDKHLAVKASAKP